MAGTVGSKYSHSIRSGLDVLKWKLIWAQWRTKQKVSNWNIRDSSSGAPSPETVEVAAIHPVFHLLAHRLSPGPKMRWPGLLGFVAYGSRFP